MADVFSYEVGADDSGAVCVVSLVGKLDPVGAEELAPALTELFEAGRRRFVIDFSRLEYIGSLGLRDLLTLHKQLKPTDGKVVLSAVSPQVRRVIDLTRLNSVLRSYETTAEAIEAIRSA